MKNNEESELFYWKLFNSGQTIDFWEQGQTRWTFFRVKFIFECDFEISWSLGPWDPWTLGLLDLFPPPTSHTFSYILLPPPVSSSYSPPLVWFGMVLVWFGKGGGCWVVTFEIEVGDGLLTFILMLKSWGGWWRWVYLDYNISSGPFLSYEIELEMDQDPSLTIFSFDSRMTFN